MKITAKVILLNTLIVLAALCRLAGAILSGAALLLNWISDLIGRAAHTSSARSQCPLRTIRTREALPMELATVPAVIEAGDPKLQEYIRAVMK